MVRIIYGTIACSRCGEEIIFDKDTVDNELKCGCCDKIYKVSRNRNQIIITDSERL